MVMASDNLEVSRMRLIISTSRTSCWAEHQDREGHYAVTVNINPHDTVNRQVIPTAMLVAHEIGHCVTTDAADLARLWIPLQAWKNEVAAWLWALVRLPPCEIHPHIVTLCLRSYNVPESVIKLVYEFAQICKKHAE